MKAVKRNGISWFLEDEGLVPLIEGLVVGVRSRRTHECISQGSRQVFVKYFVEKGIPGALRNKVCPRGKKEYILGKKLASLCIAAPNPMGYGIGRAGSFILQERIEAVPFRAAFDDGVRREGLLDGLALLLKQMREQQVRHNDLHLENVMVSGERLYLIDLHKTCIRRRRFSTSDELVNLTHALTMIYDGLTEDEKSRFFRRYGRPDIRRPMEEGLLSLWRAWIRSKKKRAFSSTSKLVAMGSRVCVRDSVGLGDGRFLGLIKKDKKVIVEAHDDHIRKVYRDRRRLAKAWEAHVVLEYLEMPVGPRPFYIQKASLFNKGYIAMEDLRGHGAELDRFLDREYDGMSPGQRRRFVDALSRFVRDLLKKGVFHRDLKACNLFVLPDGFRLLDIEDVQFRLPGDEDLRRMFVQLNTSIPGRITGPERIRFFAIVTRGSFLDRKRLFRSVVRASLEEGIVYEGVAGLRRESWQGRRQDPPPRSSPPLRRQSGPPSRPGPYPR
jgi:tRNA A-37 threonylcarbamoyl transferase component Bud32